MVIKQLSRFPQEGNHDVLDFEPGVNVIVGKPNTGKTRWLSMLDYALGSRNTPEDVFGNDLATKYASVQVTLEIIIIGGVEVEFYIDGVLVATHSTRVPDLTLDWQHILVTAGAGGGDAIDVTVRDGWCQEAPA